MGVSALRTGLVGVGHLGKVHARCLAELPPTELEFVGVFDTDREACAKTARTYSVRAFESYAELLDACDAVDVVTPTRTHYVLAKAALEAGLHVFIEKPVTERVAEVAELEELATRRARTVQVGHVERFNPALLAVGGIDLRPVFIEAHRLASFNPRSNDVSVVLDLMIHDLDIVLSLVPSEVETVSASGVGVVGDSVDIANARLDFVDGTTANLTASRISLKSMRKLRLFQRDAYIGIDMLEKKTEVVRLSDHDPASPGPFQLPTPEGLREVVVEYPEVYPTNAILEELRQFCASVREGAPIAVDLRAGRRALDVAHRILADIELRRAKLTVEATR